MKLKNERGITLVSLVVTIIVLIILAAVTINMTIGADGIITRAKNARENMEIAVEQEQQRLNELYYQMDIGEIVDYSPAISLKEFKQRLAEVITQKGVETSISATEEEIIENIKKIETGNTSNYAPYDDPYIPEGFTHTAGTWNNGYTITETSTGNKFVWVPCVNDQNKVKSGDRVVTFERILPTTTATTDSYYMYNKSNLPITGEQNDTSTKVALSVEKYGGFYIAAYEAGVPVDNNGNEIAATSATVTQKARSVAGATVWTNITRTNAITAASNMINTSDGVKSCLITGTAWDTTLQWMVTTSENSASNAGYDIDSTGNGWYSDVSSDSKTTTGKYPINNIYDMAGNLWEWTTENGTNSGTSCFVARGGSYVYSGLSGPAACRLGNTGGANGAIAFRVVLYK